MNTKTNRNMRRSEAAAYVSSEYGPMAPQTLAKLACVGGGPPFRKFGRFPIYSVSDLDAWAASRTTPLVEHTSGYAV